MASLTHDDGKPDGGGNTFIMIFWFRENQYRLLINKTKMNSKLL